MRYRNDITVLDVCFYMFIVALGMAGIGLGLKEYDKRTKAYQDVSEIKQELKLLKEQLREKLD